MRVLGFCFDLPGERGVVAVTDEISGWWFVLLRGTGVYLQIYSCASEEQMETDFLMAAQSYLKLEPQILGPIVIADALEPSKGVSSEYQWQIWAHHILDCVVYDIGVPNSSYEPSIQP